MSFLLKKRGQDGKLGLVLGFIQVGRGKIEGKRVGWEYDGNIMYSPLKIEK
jgi:hypothetical protein